MVASLAAKLAAHPDDPEGWARLVRSYGVLHDRSAQADALAKARRALAGRADALAAVEGEARSHPG
jgi:cytochrome c-type biogenesis protein CcmH